MSYWLNNFIDFEIKRNRENRLILNFSYVPNENGEISKAIKIYTPRKVKVSTWFLPPDKAEQIADWLTALGKFEKDSIRRRKHGKFEIIDVEIPKNPALLDELWKLGFQTSDYTKMLRYQGFYPERKASLEQRILSDINGKDEIEIPDLNGIRFGGFLTEDEARELPYVILDIEKPLWKKPREKQLIDMTSSAH